MINFILNNKEINTSLSPGITLLDFIRYKKDLMGTKIGCREGDCGACTVLVGEIQKDELVYSSVTSCLMATGNADRKHIVTIEGINTVGLNTVQQAFSDEGATQCGFCTPGFIVSLTCFCLMNKSPAYESAIDSMNGNICRCTGYKSIERAASIILQKLHTRNNEDLLEFAVRNNFIPDYFLGIKERLRKLSSLQPGQDVIKITKKLGGGTDLYVQQCETMPYENIDFLLDKKTLTGIIQKGNICEMGGSATAADIAESPIFQEHFGDLKKYIKLISSTQIRNMATVAGNFSNASPIGDFTIFFLAMNATLILSKGDDKRVILLRDFYQGYKLLNKSGEEIIEQISFELPAKNDLFNFEKVCKRTNLDIASVNTAILCKVHDNQISEAGLSAGGVGPVPMFLKESSHFLAGKKISAEVVKELIAIVQQEITPITDARGTETYKRLLLGQLIKAHFIKLFPSLSLEKTLIA